MDQNFGMSTPLWTTIVLEQKTYEAHAKCLSTEHEHILYFSKYILYNLLFYKPIRYNTLNSELPSFIDFFK